jgi:hypothetical protein
MYLSAVVARVSSIFEYSHPAPSLSDKRNVPPFNRLTCNEVLKTQALIRQLVTKAVCS